MIATLDQPEDGGHDFFGRIALGFAVLDEKEVAAISEHEHIPEIAAAALASYLLSSRTAAKLFER